MSKHLFINVTVLDCSGDEPFRGEVLVEGNEIVAVAREGESLHRDGAEIIDGGDGTTLMPGLVESHAHLSIDNTDDLAALGRIPPEEHTLLTMHNARLYLDHGITSCISAASAKPEHSSSEVCLAIASAAATVSRIASAPLAEVLAEPLRWPT